ncbi:hypothetical protein ABK040_015364 [Willaertia magna]
MSTKTKFLLKQFNKSYSTSFLKQSKNSLLNNNNTNGKVNQQLINEDDLSKNIIKLEKISKRNISSTGHQQDIKHGNDTLNNYWKDVRNKFISVFLPKGYPNSVSDNYLNYCKWQAAQYIAGSFSGVLSMQALLYAAGITSNTITVAMLGGALAWIIKDGLGQLGGILFASKVNTNFDADPKYWRLRGEYALIASALLEILSPLSGAKWFILQASIANIGKNISCFAAGATRAAMNQSFAKSDNLADVTAKATSQTLASSLIGTGLGITFSSLFSLTTYSFATIFPVFCALSFIQLYSLYKAVSCVRLRVLNKQRFFILCSKYLESNGATVLTPTEVSKLEKFVITSFEKFQNIIINPSIDKLAPLVTENDMDSLSKERYLVKESGNKIYILFTTEATTLHVMRAMFLSTCLLNNVELSKGDAINQLNGHVDTFINAIENNGWAVNHDFVEEKTHMRLQIEKEENL